MRDVILHIDSYSEPTPRAAIQQAATFAGAMGCSITGLAIQIDIEVPQNWLAERLLNVSQLANVEEAKSLDTARGSLRMLEELAKAAGINQQGLIERAPLHGVGPYLAARTRTRDLCLIAVGAPVDPQRGVAEEVIFGSGRPVLVFHPERAPLTAQPLSRVAIAWDGSRCAARAVSDALPILRKASDVRVLTIVGEKKQAVSGIAIELLRHLSLHDIQAQVDEVEHRGGSIGASIDAYCAKSSPDLLVMGAYGSSRVKEFLLGGATEHILNSGRVAAFLSH